MSEVGKVTPQKGLTMRKLNARERKVVEEALRYLSISSLKEHLTIRWAAEAMLEQKMPENFWWQE